MKRAIFSHMSVVITSRKKNKEEVGWFFLWENTEEEFSPAVLSLCSSLSLSVFVSLCLFIHIFFLRKHNSPELTRSQGEHDHGNHTGDQSQRRLSGKRDAAFCGI